MFIWAIALVMPIVMYRAAEAAYMDGVSWAVGSALFYALALLLLGGLGFLAALSISLLVFVVACFRRNHVA